MTRVVPGASSIDVALDRHAQRRASGLPTVTLLLEHSDHAADAAWRAWAGRRRLGVIEIDEETAAAKGCSLSSRLLAAVLDGRVDLHALTLRHLSQRTGRAVCDLRAAIGGEDVDRPRSACRSPRA